MENVKKFFKYENVGWLFVLPAFLYMLVFVGYPIIQNFILSFQDVTVATLRSEVKEFVGFKNYIELFKTDDILMVSLKNTLYFTVFSLLIQFIIGFSLALLFKNKFTGSKPIRGLLMIPWMIPITVTALIFKLIFGTDIGVFNYFLTSLGIVSENIEWLTSTATAMPAVIFANIWIGIPFNMILISTGLSIIPQDVYESASIDGANKTQTFFKITLPLLRPTIESVLILGFIYTFKVFDLVYVMTSGGPVNSTQVLSTYSYKLSFEMFKYSKGAAVANILFIILFFVSLIYLRYVYSEEEN